jgi:LmbE family N-acetylglucosaminyl deacetylase
MSNTVLVVAAHADDEVLGCGGTIAKHVANRDSVHLVIMADGVRSRASADQTDLEIRRKAALASADILGISSVRFLDYPDNKLDTVPMLDLAHSLELVVQDIKPSIVYTHHHGDLNIDHRLTHAAVLTCNRPQPHTTVREIFGFEVPSSTEWATPQEKPFLPTLFVDIDNYLEFKLKALDAYALEMRNPPHSRSISHVDILARHRGFCVGVAAAEAFMVYRICR